MAANVTAGRPTLAQKSSRLRFHAGGRDRRSPKIHNVGQLTSLKKIKFSLKFPSKLEFRFFNVAQSKNLRIIFALYYSLIYIYIIDFSTMLSKFNIVLWTRIVQKFCPSLPLNRGRRTARIWNFRTKRWITTQGPPSTAGFPLSGPR